MTNTFIETRLHLTRPRPGLPLLRLCLIALHRLLKSVERPVDVQTWIVPSDALARFVPETPCFVLHFGNFAQGEECVCEPFWYQELMVVAAVNSAPYCPYVFD